MQLNYNEFKYFFSKISQNGQIFKIKFLITLKLNFNRGQFYKQILNFGFSKKIEKCYSKIVKFTANKVQK